MGTKYSSQSISGYNNAPPSDDGTQSEANKVKWSTIKSKLADTLKTFAENINTAIANALDYSTNTQATNYTTVAGDHDKVIQVTASATITALLAATAGAGYRFGVSNQHSAAITVARSGSDTFPSAATTYSVQAGQLVWFYVNAAGDGYLVETPATGTGAPVRANSATLTGLIANNGATGTQATFGFTSAIKLLFADTGTYSGWTTAASALGTGMRVSTTNSEMVVSGTAVVTATSSGASVTGTLSSTDRLLAGGASISSGGNAFYGANANGINFHRNTSTAGCKYWSTGPDNSHNYVVFNQGAVGMYMTDGGTSWVATSDERHKDIIEPITNAIAKVGGLRTVIGKFKSDDTDKRRVFLIAQDVLAVLPEAVDTQNADKLGLQYTDVIPLLVAAVKELSAEVAALKSAG